MNRWGEQPHRPEAQIPIPLIVVINLGTLVAPLVLLTVVVQLLAVIPQHPDLHRLSYRLLLGHRGRSGGG